MFCPSGMLRPSFLLILFILDLIVSFILSVVNYNETGSGAARLPDYSILYGQYIFSFFLLGMLTLVARPVIMRVLTHVA